MEEARKYVMFLVVGLVTIVIVIPVLNALFTQGGSFDQLGQIVTGIEQTTTTTTGGGNTLSEAQCSFSPSTSLSSLVASPSDVFTGSFTAEDGASLSFTELSAKLTVPASPNPFRLAQFSAANAPEDADADEMLFIYYVQDSGSNYLVGYSWDSEWSASIVNFECTREAALPPRVAQCSWIAGYPPGFPTSAIPVDGNALDAQRFTGDLTGAVGFYTPYEVVATTPFNMDADDITHLLVFEVDLLGSGDVLVIVGWRTTADSFPADVLDADCTDGTIPADFVGMTGHSELRRVAEMLAMEPGTPFIEYDDAGYIGAEVEFVPEVIENGYCVWQPTPQLTITSDTTGNNYALIPPEGVRVDIGDRPTAVTSDNSSLTIADASFPGGVWTQENVYYVDGPNGERFIVAVAYENLSSPPDALVCDYAAGDLVAQYAATRDSNIGTFRRAGYLIEPRQFGLLTVTSIEPTAITDSIYAPIISAIFALIPLGLMLAVGWYFISLFNRRGGRRGGSRRRR